MGENKNNDLYEISVDGKTAKLKKPNRQTMKIALTKIRQGEEIDAGQILLNTCWVEGDKELKDDLSDENAEINITACYNALGLIEIKQGDLKKL